MKKGLSLLILWVGLLLALPVQAADVIVSGCRDAGVDWLRGRFFYTADNAAHADYYGFVGDGGGGELGELKPGTYEFLTVDSKDGTAITAFIVINGIYYEGTVDGDSPVCEAVPEITPVFMIRIRPQDTESTDTDPTHSHHVSIPKEIP